MEVIERRTPNSKTFIQEDGSYQTRIYGRDVHYLDVDGYKEINLNIKREDNFEFEYALKDNRFRAYFNDSTDIENFTLAGFELINSNGDARWVNFKMLNATPDSSGYYGNTFTYKNVAEQVDLDYTVTPERLKENIVVHDPSAMGAFTFSIKLDPFLIFEVKDNNEVHFIDTETGEKLWEIASPFAIDAEGKRTDDVRYLFGKQSYNGVEYDSVTVEVKDTSFLENAVYPVEIDPTLVLDNSVVKDAYIQSNYDDNASEQNFGDSFFLTLQDITGGNQQRLSEILLQFDLSAIQPGSFVESAEVNLYLFDGQETGLETSFITHPVISDWDELSVTWDSRPSAEEGISDVYDVGLGGADRYVTFQATNSIQNNLRDGNAGILIKHNGNFLNEKRFYSSDYSSNHPELVITYNEPPTVPSIVAPNGGETWDASHDIEITTSTDPEGDSIAYEYQLSTDGGENWYTIMEEVTSNPVAYDFTNEPETSLARMRVRAYDDNSYSEWGESDGVFTINHNEAPEAPSNLSPNGSTINVTEVQRLEWQHNDDDGQSKAEIDWKLQGGATWNRVDANSSDEYKNINGDVFPEGEIVWRVRTYDSYGEVSPWSDEVVFTAATPTDAPTITTPTSTVNVSRPAIEWSTSEQQSYQVIIEDSLNTVLWDTGEVSSENRAVTSGVDLNNGGTYDIRVRVRNEAGLWTEYGEVTVNVSYTAPPNPELTVYKDTGTLRLEITNPTPSGTEPTVTGNDVYKRMNGEWVKVAENLGDTYYDYAVASGQEYEYRITAHGDNGTTSQSLTRSGSTTFIGTWLHDVYDPQDTLHQFLADGEGRSRTRTKDTQLVEFAGRKAPVAQSSKKKRAVVEGTLVLRNDMEYEAFERIFESDIVCYRDGRGRLEYGVIIEEPIEDEVGSYRVSYTLNRIDYSEVIE